MHSTATIDQCDTSTTADWRIFVKLKRNTVNAYIYICFVRCVWLAIIIKSIRILCFYLIPLQCLRMIHCKTNTTQKQPKCKQLLSEYVFVTDKLNRGTQERRGKKIWLNRTYKTLKRCSTENNNIKTTKIEGSIRPCNADTWYKIAPLHHSIVWVSSVQF